MYACDVYLHLLFSLCTSPIRKARQVNADTSCGFEDTGLSLRDKHEQTPREGGLGARSFPHDGLWPLLCLIEKELPFINLRPPPRSDCHRRSSSSSRVWAQAPDALIHRDNTTALTSRSAQHHMIMMPMMPHTHGVVITNDAALIGWMYWALYKGFHSGVPGHFL